jgi:competence protein ComEC
MLFVLGALCAGIAFDEVLHASIRIWLGAAVVLGAAWFVCWIGKSPLALLFLAGLVLACGGLRNQIASRQPGGLGALAPTVNSPIALEGRALSGARIVPPSSSTPLEFSPPRSQTHVLIRVSRVRDGEQWRAASGKAWLRAAGPLPEIGAGDQLRIFAEYSKAPQRGNPGEPDRSRQSRIDGVDFFLHCETSDQVQIVKRGSPNSVARWIGFQRQAWIRKLHASLGEKRGALAAAILLGAREQLDRPRLDSFLLVGMSHILVVSGANVAILAGALLWLHTLVNLPRGITFAAISLFVIWFALLTDADAPVIRAAAAMLVVLLARYYFRRVDSVQALASAGVAVLLLNPAYLFSLGAQLSFLSVATLIQVAAHMTPPARKSDPLERLLFRSQPLVFRLAIQTYELLYAALLTSFWVWVATTPLLWSQFGFLQWGPILLNPLLAIPFAALLGAGMLFLGVDGWIPGLGPILAAICRWSLDFMEGVVGAFQRAPAPMQLASPPPLWWVVLFYIAAFALIGLAPWARNSNLLASAPVDKQAVQHQARWRWLVGIAAGMWLSLGFVLGQSYQREFAAPPASLRATFLNVGHGTCVLLEFPNGQTWVYDAGNKSDGRGAARILWEAMLAAGKSRIDRLIVSHDDTDHYSALPTFLRRVRVDRIGWTRDFHPPTSIAGQYVVQSVEMEGAPQEILDDRSTWSIDGVSLRILHPSQDETFGSDNSRSIVLEIEYAGRRILLPGDLETPGLELVVSRETKPYDVVMAPHHGSERSIPQRFAGWSRPRYVIISGDEGDRRDSTIAAYIAGGATVFHTADDGAVVVTLSQSGELTVEPFRQPSQAAAPRR